MQHFVDYVLIILHYPYVACQNLCIRDFSITVSICNWELTCLLCLGDGLCLGKREPPDGPYSFIKYSEVSLFVSVYLISWIIVVVYIRRPWRAGVFWLKKYFPKTSLVRYDQAQKCLISSQKYLYSQS